MADELVSIALQKITNSVGQQVCLFAGAAREMERLRSIFESIRAVIHDAESRQLDEESVRLWLSKLRDVYHDMDDVLDDWEISGGLAGGGGEVSPDMDDVLDDWEISGALAGGEGDGEEDDGRNKVFACLFSPYNYFDRAVSSCIAARHIKQIRERLEKLDVDKDVYGFSSSSQAGDPNMLVRSRPHESEIIIGRENDKATVIERLVGGSSSHEEVGGQVPVVAVVGIGGLGKTTLVRQIYDDGRVRDHFNMFLWVCASGVFDVKILTKAILEQIKGTSSSLPELDSLQNELLRELRGKRFLLVLDGVWNDEEEKWKMLRLPLYSDARGSRILVTTRIEKVANTMNATYIHKLEGLSVDDSWALFSSRAFAGRKAEEYSVLESIGKEIVNNCRGVPLVIKVIGSLMQSKMTVEDWESILYSKIWSSTHGRDNFLPALFLTYLNIPAHLKQCFEYCSMFPKGWEFRKDSLVRFWVALGFIWPQENREIEDVAEDYCDELAAWSVFQQVQEDGETRYKMHGLYYHLAEFIFKDEIYNFVGEGQWLSSDVRHAFLSFADNDDKPSNIPIAAGRATKLRTLWLPGIDRSDRVIVDVLREAKSLRALSLMGSKSSGWTAKLTDAFWKMRHLRYLDLSGSDIVELPNAIGKMRHLRYLDFSSTNIVELPNVIGKMKYLKYLNLSFLNIVELPKSVSHLRNLHTLNLTGCVKLKRLPESVSHLRNLHTLNLTGCVKLKRLPRAMGRLVSLRHVEIERTDGLECLPEGLGRIGGLRSLCKFVVGGGEGGGCQIDEMRSLNSIQGTLRLQHLDRVSSRDEAERARLWGKPHLRRLVLSRSEESVAEGLRPHFDLEELKLFWYTGSNLPSWTGITLCLRKLELCGCHRLEGLLHHLDGFSIIEELIIRDCPRIEGIANSSSCVYLERISVIDSSEFFSSGLPHLRNLKTFEIRRFRKEALPDGGWELLSALQTLEIWNCDELKSLPDGLMRLQSLENLIIHGCDKLERLPEGLGQLKKLKSLKIGVLKALTCLPGSLGQLESLEHLEVYSCKKLESLPRGLQQLRRLSICGCPLLSERCRKGGVDWPEISHIPKIEIDKQRIQ